MIAIDFIGPLPKTTGGNAYILVASDYATKFPEAFALPDSTAETTAKCLVENLFLRYGPPRILLSDRGPNFLSDLVTSICELLNTYKVNSSGYRPQTAGLVERFNQTLLDILATYCDADQKNWDAYIPYALFAYRTTFNPAIQDTPFHLLYGYEPKLPQDLFVIPPEADESLATTRRNQIATRLNQARQLARDCLSATQQATKSQFDKAHHRTTTYPIDSYVWSIKPKLGSGTVFKLAKIYDGPYRVDAQLSDRTYRLIHSISGEPRLSHVDNMKPYRPDEDLRPQEVPKPAPLQLPADQEHRQLEKLDRTIRETIRVIPMERVRPTIAHASKDPHRLQ